jgi:hypothetical protein
VSHTDHRTHAAALMNMRGCGAKFRRKARIFTGAAHAFLGAESCSEYPFLHLSTFSTYTFSRVSRVPRAYAFSSR